ncbi:PHD finger protein 3 [Pseudogymnoascus destructans]|uniref:Transcription factor BYE1 n=2 Tax=Pseudogymnoascus destructans TaxID=655981 RepID=L8G5G7_PSED2|nr:PHD finger protein 3 [Pseudogymnoascus destructans]ELR07196.1 hypothetical protein GMDG_02423 [Pseudogymnoascus destructans 20631-21]OAF62032.1 PHD finger protein 3 [Pseudogymnoascus destructans]
MSDEPRRSVRATKGQHTKSLDQLDQPAEPSKKRGGKKASAKKVSSQEASAEEEEEDVIRCVCGAEEQDDSAGEDWIACSDCEAWQHNVCMGITTDKDVLENMEYWCERCKPENHKELLDSIARGEKLWETRLKAHDQAILEAQKNKRGRKGKGKRVSEVRAETPQNGKSKTPDAQPEAKKEKKEAASRAGSTKRKTRDESHDEALKVPKLRKVSSSPAPPDENVPKDLAQTISQLDSSRQGAAKLLNKSLQYSLKISLKNGNFQGSEEDVDPRALSFALQIERAIHDVSISKSAYSTQAKKVVANLKTNQELCERLLSRSLTPSVLAVMNEDDMASKELQRQTAEMKARADKQAIMITEEDGPRIRRTHKGDEVIEDEQYEAATEEMPASRRRSMLDPNHGMGARSREHSPGEDEHPELPMDIDDYHPQYSTPSSAQRPQPISVDSQETKSAQRRASAADNFDINSVYSKVQSPTVSQHSRKPSMAAPPPQANLVQDPDIDRLLDDGTEANSPPYEPPEHAEDPSIIWHGSMVMTSICDFSATARHVAGADLSTVGTPWSNLLDPRLSVAGRIDPGKATEYLCSLRYSPKTDVTVISLSASGGERAASEFMQLYEYFRSKNRYGVVGNKTLANVRDTYLIPVPAGKDNGPEFLSNLDNNMLPTERTEPMLIIAIVVREPEGQSTLAQSYDGSGSPSVPSNHSHRQLSLGGQGPSMSLIVPQPPQGMFATQSPAHAAPTAGVTSTQPPNSEQQRQAQQLRGEAVAREILGEFITASTATFLMAQAFRMEPTEWRVIRQVFEEDPDTRGDLKKLSELLEKKGQAKAAEDAAKVAGAGAIGALQ